LWNILTHEHRPFDLIGDIDGSREELTVLRGQLGCVAAERRDGLGPIYCHPKDVRPSSWAIVSTGVRTRGVQRTLAIVEVGTARSRQSRP
jgi:hypothetical protein